MGTRFSCLSATKSMEEKNQNDASGPTDSPETPKNVRIFSYREMKSATKNFHPSNRIGRGGFGIVYKGALRDDTMVAIKSLSVESKQGINEFLTEIEMVSNVKHPNLVKLIGCCAEGGNWMLVYEYLDNNSLSKALLGPKSKCIALDWPKRAAICVGTACGLAFLHEDAEPQIVHRDIKAGNILLDKDLIPKIGDFGLAKLFPDSVTHISTRVAGTIFGVLILEIVSGRSSSKSVWGHDMKVLLEWTWKLRDEERLLDLVDPELVEYQEEQVLRFIKIALLCTQAEAHRRPSMKQVVDMLSSSSSSSKTKPDVRNLMQPSIIRDKGNKRNQRPNILAPITTKRNVERSPKPSPTSTIALQAR